jgi:Arylsulfotransferase (ASST)
MIASCRLARIAVPLFVLAAGASSVACVADAAAAAPVISPAPGTQTAMPASEISFLGAARGSLSAISVVGSSSGRHTGVLRAYSSAVGASFKPNAPFAPGEHVTVHAHWRSPAGHAIALSTSFTVATPVAVAQGAPADTPLVGTSGVLPQQSFHSQPELHPPAVTVHQAAAATSAPGLIFATPSSAASGAAQSGPMIFDDSGSLVWFHPLGAGETATELRTQTFAGRNELTWWQGRTNQFGYGQGQDVIANANYKTVATVKAGNGLQADEHGFQLTPQGSAWIVAYSPVKRDLASVGGPVSGIAIEGVIQEIDVSTGLVMWEWQSLGHVEPAESYSAPPAGAESPYDYFHIDSLQLDQHGNLLVSARNTWTVYYLNGHNGDVLWRLGGKRSSFKLGPAVPFAHQTDATLLKGGDVSLLDGEGAPPADQPSRGEIVKLDRGARTATLAGSLVRTSGPAAASEQGDVESLPGHDWMVGWGEAGAFSEFNSRGQMIYDAQLPGGDGGAGVHREPWSGQPGDPPLLSEIDSGATSTVYATWNGATVATSWQLLTGSAPAHMTAVSTTPWGGFETTIPAPSAAWYEVQALSASGRMLASSKAIPAGGGS